MIFNAMHRPGAVWQAQPGENRAGIIALKRHVVDGHHRRRHLAAGRRGKAQIGKRHRRLPVMRMDQIEAEPHHRAASNIRRRPAKRGKPPPIVFPVKATVRRIGPPLALKQIGAINHQQRMAANRASQQLRRFAQQRGPCMERFGIFGGFPGRLGGR